MSGYGMAACGAKRSLADFDRWRWFRCRKENQRHKLPWRPARISHASYVGADDRLGRGRKIGIARLVIGLIPATAYFADAAKRAALKVVVNMSQISRGKIPKATPRATTGSPNAFSIGLAFLATILAKPAAHVGKTYTLCGPTELDQAGIAAAITEVLGRKISYQPLTIPQYRERLEKAGLSEFMIQHFCAVALDYQSGLFSGEDKIIAELTGKPPMIVQDFVASHREAFTTVSAEG